MNQVLHLQVCTEVESTNCLSQSDRNQLLVMANLEATLVSLEYRDPMTAAKHLEQIGTFSGFTAELTGILVLFALQKRLYLKAMPKK